MPMEKRQRCDADNSSVHRPPPHCQAYMRSTRRSLHLEAQLSSLLQAPLALTHDLPPCPRTMAEALATIGVVASIVQLVHFGRRVLRRLDDCRSNFGEVPKTFQHVHTELPVLLDTLQRTQTLISDGSASDETRTALQPAIDGFRTQVEALDAIMKATTPTLGDSRATRTKKTILCLGKDAKVKAILSTMRGYTQTLTFYHATVASMPRIQSKLLAPLLIDINLFIFRS